MPVGYKPSVFVSSTCFDLGQVRADIRELIETFGLDPVLSEYDSFPVSSSNDTIANCLQNVRDKADIFILIVGSRYGYQTENGQSITNLEYLEAKKKGIPVYVFINSDVMNILPIWKNSPEADFSSHVENKKVLEFVEQLTHFSSNWVYKFDSAKEIKSALTQQIPYLFMDALVARTKLTKNNLILPQNKYSVEAANIILDKPDFWEYKLFVELLNSYMQDLADKRFDLKYGISFNNNVVIDDVSEVMDWIGNQTDELINLIGISTILINEAAANAFGEPGVAGEHDKIQHVCQRFIEVYSRLIDWKLAFLTLKVEEEFDQILKMASCFADGPLSEIEDYCSRTYKYLYEAINEVSLGNKSVKLDFSFTFESPEMSGYKKEFDRLNHKYF
ncbi:DUF4062 domain-containing protein [Cognaticolwellia beringensis]|uniref:DUF4062 domain-containing protein n=1 Tax=Cognaticolwellia beringensis TaxID=1967665 RepID=A0A222GC43_9GAMM|nr:DUF4062 domain-containing protein [Cognaticolwellia beringensis]ASP49458.1 DUF4062 domain-containing protein [Cognaticolwellia beringensis]